MNNDEKIRDAEDMIAAIKEYAETNKDFNLNFIESVDEQICMKGSITDKQYNALSNICNKFEIDW